MQKKLLILLSVLVVGLLIANVVVLTLGLQRLADKNFSKPSSETETAAPSSASSGPALQIKQGTFKNSFVALSNSAADEKESIGTQTGKTVGELQQKTAESYDALNQQAQQTAAELDKTSQEAMKVLNEQAAKTSQDLQLALSNILQNFSVELQKFNEELKKKQTA